MKRLGYFIGAIISAALVAACGGPVQETLRSPLLSGSATTQQLPEYVLRSSGSTVNWGVAAQGRAGGSEWTLVGYCDKTPGNSCTGDPPILFGKRSMMFSGSATETCPNEAGNPTCSGALSVTSAIGTVNASASISCEGSNGCGLSAGQETDFLDQITVTSSLPNGTPVTIKETANLTGAGTCGNAFSNDGTYYVRSGIGQSAFILQGQCSFGNPIVPMKGSTKFSSTVGATFSLAPAVSNNLFINFGPDSASMQLKVVYHLKSLTQNVTLVSASGKIY